LPHLMNQLGLKIHTPGRWQAGPEMDSPALCET